MKQVMAVLVVLGLASGCVANQSSRLPESKSVIIEAEYEPRTRLQPGRTAVSALRLYEDDIDLLPPETKVIGTFAFIIRASAPKEDIVFEVEEAIAKKGGTHYFPAVNRVYEQKSIERDDEAETLQAVAMSIQKFGCNMRGKEANDDPDCRVSYRDLKPIYKEKRWRERVMIVTVIAIRPKEWDDMPDQMRPKRWSK